jgi:parvulin-like peptidyl-prolyl isomerase
VTQPIRNLATGGIFALAMALAVLPHPAPAQSTDINKVILRVNDRITTLYDYLSRRADMRNAVLAGQLSPEERERAMAEIPQRVMRDLFQEALLLSRADQMEIFIAPEEVEAEIARLRQQLEMTDEAVFERALEEAGLDPEKYREQVEASLMINEVMGTEVREKAQVTEEDLRRYYRAHPEEFRVPERRRAGDLVVLDTSDLDDTARRELAERLRLSLAAGEAMEDLIAQHEPEGRTSGALDLGWVQPGDLTPELESALWQLNVGEYSAPVASRGGLHILYLEEVEESYLREFNDVRADLQRQESNRRYGEAISEYMAELEGLAYIVEDIPADAAGYRAALPTTGPGIREPFKILGETETGAPDDSLRASPQPETE